MNLEQYVSEKCKVTCSLYDTNAVEQSIFLMLPDSANDEEKASVVAKVTNTLVQNGWVIVDMQIFNHIEVEYTKNCDPMDVIDAMLSCVK